MTGHTINSYCNPIRTENLPDPFVLKVRGRYYLYSTEPELCPDTGTMVFPILRSENLVAWHPVGKAMSALGSPYCRYWAPEVTYDNGRFFLYYAVHTEEFKGSIRVAVAEQPEGPFRDSGHDLTCHLTPWAIDPHIFRDYDGQWYLYMTIEYWNDPNGLTGSGNAVARLLNPFLLEDNLTRVTPPGQAWQLFQQRRPERGNVDWYTVEGPAILRNRNTYYELFSGGCYYRDNYAMSYATSTVPMGTKGMADTSWRDWQGTHESTLLVQGNREHALSPGHNSIVLGPNNVDSYIVYHVLQPDMVKRYPSIDRLFLHGKELWTNAPTYTDQPAPALPRLQETWTTPTLASSWQAQTGQWQQEEESVVQQDSKIPQASLRQREPLQAAWLLEIHTCALEGQGAYGIAVDDADGWLARIVLVPAAHELRMHNSDGITVVFPLPENFVAETWHQLLISYAGRLLSVQLDYWQPRELELVKPPLYCSLYTEDCAARFGPVTLAACFRDEFLNERQSLDLLGWRGVVVSGVVKSVAQWRIHEGTLEQPEQLDEHLLLKGASCLEYECGATMQLRENEAGQQQAGLIARYTEDEQLFVWLTRESSIARLVIEGRGKLAFITYGHELDAAFDPRTWHTLRVLQRKEQMQVWLDGKEVCTLKLQAQSSMCGVGTHSSGAAFMSVWQTELGA